MTHNHTSNPYALNKSAAETLAQRLNKVMPNWWQHIRGGKILNHGRVPDAGACLGTSPLIDVRDPMTCEALRTLVILAWPGCRVQVNDAGANLCFVKVWSPQSKRYVYNGDEDRLAIAYIKAIESGKATHRVKYIRRRAA